MPRNLYSPRLSDDVVRALYREGQRRRKPMTVVADTLLRQSLGRIANDPSLLRVCEDPQPFAAIGNPEASDHQPATNNQQPWPSNSSPITANASVSPATRRTSSPFRWKPN